MKYSINTRNESELWSLCRMHDFPGKINVTSILVFIDVDDSVCVYVSYSQTYTHTHTHAHTHIHTHTHA